MPGLGRHERVHTVVLRSLTEAGPATCLELAKRVGVPQVNTANALGALWERGLVVRHTDGVYSVTAAGRERVGAKEA